MKKIFLFLLLAFSLKLSASVVINDNLLALNDSVVDISSNPIESSAITKEESKISETIAKIRSSLKSLQTDDLKVEEKAETDNVEIAMSMPPKEEVVKKESSMEAEKVKEVEKETVKKDTFVVLNTEKGDVKIKLYMEKAPITAGNFLDLAKKKFYNGLTFHRLIKGFMIQGGCPLGNGTGNYVDPETKKPRYIKHESHPDLKHDKEGVVAMARTSDPNSASSQFFIDLGPQPFLNAGGSDPYGYAVFGQVTEGMDVVHKIMKENVAPYPGSDGTSNPVKIVTVQVIE